MRSEGRGGFARGAVGAQSWEALAKKKRQIWEKGGGKAKKLPGMAERGAWVAEEVRSSRKKGCSARQWEDRSIEKPFLGLQVEENDALKGIFWEVSGKRN